MPKELTQLVSAASPAPTIGEHGVKLHQHALRHRIDFYDTAGRLHGMIALVPIVYGMIQTQRGEPLQPWFWWTVAATIGFAIFARRAPFLRISPAGISFPEKKSPVYKWEEMCEAHARKDELDILLADGQHVTISYRNMRATDIDKLKRLIKSQFQYMAASAQSSVAQAA